MKFIDLFAGLGGFHLALQQLGHECVFASEIDSDLAELYAKNFGMKPVGDIRKIELSDIPSHDILCGGFPCQSFSMAGKKKGLKCEKNGDLIDIIAKILGYHKPKFFLLENVPNILVHDNGKTWNKILKKLTEVGYNIDFSVFSPHQFGIPQKRKRVFIVGKLAEQFQFLWPKPNEYENLSIDSILEKNPVDSRILDANHRNYLNTWQELLINIPENEKLPSIPLWAMEFGATYPIDKTPHSTNFCGMEKYKGAFGKSLKGLSIDETKNALPPYALDKSDRFRDWKMEYLRVNRAFYKKHKSIIVPWLKESGIKSFQPSFQKLEWRANSHELDIWKYIIQFRQSGIRVRRKDYAPTLTTAESELFLAWKNRYMSIRECGRLQSMHSLKYIPKGKKAFIALGNAVNVHVVQMVASKFSKS